MIKDINITINVSDLNISISFYKKLGFTLLNRWGDHYAQLESKGFKIGLHPTDQSHLKGTSGNVSIGITSENFEMTRQSLTDKKISFTERQEEGGDFLHFNDPDGTSLYFINPKW